MPSPESPNAVFERLLGIVSRRRWLVTVLVAFGVAISVPLVMNLPEVYRSSATILIERQQIPEAFVKSTITTEVDRRLQGISKALMSRSRLAAMIEKYGLYADLRAQLPIDDVIDRMRSNVVLTLQGVNPKDKNTATVAFTVSYLGEDPQRVALVTNELASLYIEEDLRVRERQASGTADFLRAELEAMKKKLDEQERRVSQFKEQYIGELPQQEQANLSTLERLNGQLLLNNEKQARAREERALLEKQVADLSGTGSTTQPDTLAARLAKAMAEVGELQKTYTAKYPDVVRLNDEIARLKERLAEAPPSDGTAAPYSAGVDPGSVDFQKNLREVDAEIRVLKAEEQNLRSSIARYQERVENTPRREQEFQALSRDYDTTQEVYRSMLKRLEEAKLAESLERNQKGEQFRILDPATTPLRPFAPNRMRLILTGILGSLAVAGAAMMLAEMLDTSFHDIDDLRRFSRVPVLAVVQRIVTESDRRAARARFQLFATTVMIALSLAGVAAFFVAGGNERLTWLLS